MPTPAELFERLVAAHPDPPAPPPELAPPPAALVPYAGDPRAAEFEREQRSKELAREAKDKLNEARISHAEMLILARQVAAKGMEKTLEFLSDPEWLKEQGAIGLSALTKLFEMVNKETRLNNGQATDVVASVAFDFGALSSDERAAVHKAMKRKMAAQEGADE